MTSAVVIYSGGMDSYTVLHAALQQHDTVHAVSFDYGQRHRKELECAVKVCAQKGVSHRIVDITALNGLLQGSALTTPGIAVPEGHYAAENMKQTVVPNRNMILLSIAAGYAISLKADQLYYGAHAGDHCLPASAPVMTPRGPIPISELKAGDTVYSVNPDTGILIEDKVKHVWEQGSPKTLLEFRTTKNSKPLRVTDNHHVWAVRNTSMKSSEFIRELVKIEAKELHEGDFLLQPMSSDLPDNMDGQEVFLHLLSTAYGETHAVTTDGSCIQLVNKKTGTKLLPMKFNMTSVIELVAWYICEGCSTPDDKVVKGQSRFLSTFYQRKNKNALEVENIIKCLEDVVGIPRFNVTKGIDGQEFEDWTFNISGTASAVLKTFGSCSLDKHIPEVVFTFLCRNSEARERFLTVCLEADGHTCGLETRGSQYSFCSTSSKFIEQIRDLFILQGARVQCSDLEQDTQYLNISFSKVKKRMVSFKNHWLLPILSIDEVENFEKVYDIEVEKNHTYLSEGVVVSNCIYPDCREEFINAMRKVFGLCDWHEVELAVPFLHGNKKTILEWGFNNGLDYVDTWTCYNGQEEACGKCGSCLERIEAFAAIGKVDPVPYVGGWDAVVAAAKKVLKSA